MQIGEGEVLDPTTALGGAVDGGIVETHEGPIGGEVEVCLEVTEAELVGAAKRHVGVLRPEHAAPAMGDGDGPTPALGVQSHPATVERLRVFETMSSFPENELAGPKARQSPIDVSVDYSATRSFKPLEALKCAYLRAGMVIVWPVAGLRP